MTDSQKYKFTRSWSDNGRQTKKFIEEDPHEVGPIMDAKLRNLLKKTQQEPTEENIGRLRKEYIRNGYVMCPMVYSAPTCPEPKNYKDYISVKCLDPADLNTYIRNTGPVCKECLSVIPLDYHSDFHGYVLRDLENQIHTSMMMVTWTEEERAEELERRLALCDLCYCKWCKSIQKWLDDTTEGYLGIFEIDRDAVYVLGEYNGRVLSGRANLNNWPNWYDYKYHWRNLGGI